MFHCPTYTHSKPGEKEYIVKEVLESKKKKKLNLSLLLIGKTLDQQTIHRNQQRMYTPLSKSKLSTSSTKTNLP